jgi:hypothetical protein
VGFSSFQLFPFSMLPDTVEYDQMQSGLRREGVFSGLWSAGQKIGYSVGPPIVGYALALSGFVREGVQPESLAIGVRVIFCIFPGAHDTDQFPAFAVPAHRGRIERVRKNSENRARVKKYHEKRPTSGETVAAG